jgi:beta-1,4-glucosyltransferase
VTTRRNIGGFPVRNVTTKTVVRFLKLRLTSRRKTVVFFANANFIVQCHHLLPTVEGNPDVCILNDGVAVDLVAWLKYGSKFIENMNGTDFTPRLLSQLGGNLRVFLLGSSQGVIGAAEKSLSMIPDVQIIGTSDGYTIWNTQADIINRINNAHADILLVALGNPRQENWILQHCAELNAPILIGVGALFDFLAGSVPRAPALLRKLRLEWAYRLACEPRRLAGRYTVGIIRFLALSLISNRGEPPVQKAKGGSEEALG